MNCSFWLLFKYVYLTQEQRRALLESNSAMEAGKRVGDALQRTYAETIYKINPFGDGNSSKRILEISENFLI